jgi:O-antigen ligase
MLAIPGIVALVVFIYARPQEFYEPLRAVPFLYVFLGLALYGALLDLRLGNLRLRATPQLPWVALLLAWGAATVLIRDLHAAIGSIFELSICVILYLLVAHGVQSFRALRTVAGVVLAMVVLVCGVGVHQGFSPTGCVVVDESDENSGTPDGRPCASVRTCYLGEAEPGAEYTCEHIGLLGTTSVGRGRVRYRGVLQDPNELALAGGIGLPLAFAFGRRPRKRRRIFKALTFALVVTCIVLTRSRGGQLVLLAVLGSYFLIYFGKKGFAVGALLAAPVLLLGGRDSAEASSSTLQRLDCWSEALSLGRSHPLLGVGLGRFAEYNELTAHNSYLLALSELGLPGMIVFSIVMYLSAKIPFVILAQTASPGAAGGIESEGVAVARPWAMALIAAMVGLGAGVFFLSFTYHYVLWIYVGLTGALYQAVRAHHPSLRVPFGWRDLMLVAMADAAIVVVVYAYVRWRLG